MAIDRSAFQDFVTQSAGADLRQRVRDTLIGLDQNGEATTPPAGWYPGTDPSQPPRYWDGTSWSDRTSG
jgi:hypothetical protein